MKSMRVKGCGLLLCIAAVSVTGCFGDSVLSAGAKVLGGQISELSANEIQILNQTAIDIIASQNVGYTAPVVTVPEAQALSTFFKANNINTIDDLTALADKAENDPSLVQGYDQLAAAFAGGAFDQGDNFDSGGLKDLFQTVIAGAQ